MRRYEASPGNVLVALFVAPVLPVLFWLGYVIFQHLINNMPSNAASAWHLNLFIIPVAIYVAFVIGVIVLGSPIWWLFDRVGLTHWLLAMVVGFLCPFLVVFLYLTNDASSLAFSIRVNLSLIFGLSGGAIGLAIWRIAYRRA